jgi:hypothetical protein
MAQKLKFKPWIMSSMQKWNDEPMAIEKFKKLYDVFQISYDVYIEEWTKVK